MQHCINYFFCTFFYLWSLKSGLNMQCEIFSCWSFWVAVYNLNEASANKRWLKCQWRDANTSVEMKLSLCLNYKNMFQDGRWCYWQHTFRCFEHLLRSGTVRAVLTGLKSHETTHFSTNFTRMLKNKGMESCIEERKIQPDLIHCNGGSIIKMR